MKRVLQWIGLAVLAIVLLVGVAYAWAYHVGMRHYQQQWTIHRADFPIPFPLGDEDLAALRDERIAGGASEANPLAGVDLQAMARDHAIRRGESATSSRSRP